LGFRDRRLLDRGRHSTRTNLSFLCSTFGILHSSRMGAIGSVAFRSVGTRIADCHRNGRWILRPNSGLGFSVCIWSRSISVSKSPTYQTQNSSVPSARNLRKKIILSSYVKIYQLSKGVLILQFDMRYIFVILSLFQKSKFTTHLSCGNFTIVV